MMFKDLKAGYPIYVLDRNAVAFKTGKVKNVGMSRLDNKIGSPTEMVVDVDIDINGVTKSLILKDASDTAYYNELMFSTDKDAILREVEIIRSQAEEALSKVEYYNQTVTNCNSLIADLNPAEKEKKMFDDRLSSVEGATKRIETALADLIKELKN